VKVKPLLKVKVLGLAISTDGLDFLLKLQFFVHQYALLTIFLLMLYLNMFYHIDITCIDIICIEITCIDITYIDIT